VRFPLLPLLLRQHFELLGVRASGGRVVIAGEGAEPGGPGMSSPLAWVGSLPPTLRVARLRIELEGKPGTPPALVVERASAGRCGDRLEVEARRQGVPLTLTATLVCPDGTRLGLSRFEARLGESTLAGSLELDPGGPRPRLSGEITSADLRIEELTALVRTGSGDARPFLDAELPRATPASLDFGLKLAGSAIRTPWAALGDIRSLAGRVGSESGRIDLEVAEATLWDGALTGRLGIDGASAEPQVSLHASLEGASVARLFAEGRATGRLDAQLGLEGHGRTPRALLAASAGSLKVRHGPVDFDAPPLGLVGRDLIGILFSHRRSGRIECAAARSAFRNGLGPLAIVLDTPNTTLAGVGPLDLRGLSLEVVLRPRPHRASLGVLKTPVLVSGPIAHPRARLATEALLKGLGRTALFSAFNPFLLTAAFVDLGTGDGNPCDQVLEAATVHALEQEGGLGRSIEAAGKGWHWLEGLLDREPSRRR
jgi:hypothetical protein